MTTVRPQVFFLDGLHLRYLRRQRGLSQQTLADHAGLSVTTVARLERQTCAPCRGRTLGRLARALGEHPVQLCAALEATARQHRRQLARQPSVVS